VAKYLTTNSTANILPSVNSETKRPMQANIYAWITNCQKQNAYVSVLILYVGMLFLFWIYGCWRSSAKWASHLNLAEWTVNCNAQLLLDCECLTSNNRSDSDLQFALPKASSNSGAKMIKHSAIEIWSRISLEIKNKTSLVLYLRSIRNKKYV